jgi:hypothetical protein
MIREPDATMQPSPQDNQLMSKRRVFSLKPQLRLVIALDLWRDYIMKSHDDRTVRDLLHPDAVFESPVVHTPQPGRDIVFKYLTTADKVMGGPNFRYVGEWRSDSGVVLEFETEIEGIKINGVDMITFSADGSLITHFKVMVRPLKAINLLHRLMGEQLAKP